MMRRAILPIAALATVATSAAAQQAGQPPAAPPAASRPAAPTAKPPAPGPLRRYDFPKVEQFSLANGVRVILVERHTLPVVSAQMLVEAGASYEPAEKVGVAVLTGDLLSEGTRSLGGAELAERMERLGAQLATSADFIHAYVGVNALSSAFPEAAALAATTITEPAFAGKDVERVKAEALANYEQERASTEGVAADVFNRAVYERTARYALPPEGTKESIAALTRDDLVRWHQKMYGPANTTVLIVGDITVPEAHRTMTRALGSWRGAAPKLGDVPNPPQRVTGTRVILVDRPGSVQSSIRIGQASLAATDPDYLPFTALSRVLGGGAVGRLQQTLREKRGFTYGAGTILQLRRGPGAFYGASQVRTNATDSALVDAVAEFKRIAAEPVPAPELEGAVSNLVGSFPSSVQTVQGLAQRLQSLLAWQMPLDFYTTYRERLAKVTPSDVARVAKKDLNTGALTIVVVGDLSKVEQPVRALSLGKVEVWDVEGKKVRD